MHSTGAGRVQTSHTYALHIPVAQLFCIWRKGEKQNIAKFGIHEYLTEKNSYLTFSGFQLQIPLYRLNLCSAVLFEGGSTQSHLNV